jgi:hypothetical protein
VANTPPHPLNNPACTQEIDGAELYNRPLSVIKGATSTCGGTGGIYANPTQLVPPRSAVRRCLGGLCALPGSPESPVTRVVDGHMLVEKFCDEEGLDDDQTEDHHDLGWNGAAVTFDTFVIDFNHMTKFFDPMDADTASDYTSDSRDDLLDGVERNRAFDNDYDLDLHELGD